MRGSLFAVVMLLALAGAARADEAGKTRAPVTPPSGTESPVSPTAQDNRIQSQVYVGEQAPGFELDGSQGRPVRLAYLRATGSCWSSTTAART